MLGPMLTAPPNTPRSTASSERLLGSRDVVGNRQLSVESIFLTVLVLLNAATFVRGLGFYLDDWLWFSTFATADDQSVRGYFDALYDPWTGGRPLQVLMMAVEFRLFGYNPLPYHLVNLAILAAAAMFLAAILRRIGLPRTFALAVAAIWVVSPSFVAERIWINVHPVSASTLLAFSGCYFDIRALDSQAFSARVTWKVGAVLAFIGSALLYETGMPLILAFSVALVALEVLRVGRLRVLAVFSLGVNAVVLAGLFAFKQAATSRGEFTASLTQLLRDAFEVMFRGLYQNFARSGLELPLHAGRALLQYGSPEMWATVTVSAILVYVWFSRTIGRENKPAPATLFMLILLGIAITAFSYVIFLPDGGVGIATAGVFTRYNIIACTGTSLALVSWLWFAASSLTTRIHIPSAAVAAVVAASVAMNSAVGSFFMEASKQQEQLISAVSPGLVSLPPGSSVLIDQACRWVGPAPVLETSIETTGVLWTAIDGRWLQGNVVNESLEVTELDVSLFDVSFRSTFSFPEVYVFRAREREWVRLPDARQAREYFESRSTLGRECPHGWPGEGVPIFPDVW